MKKTILIIFWLLFSVILPACANPTKDMTPKQKADYIAQQKYEQEDRRNIERDKLRALLLACRATGNVIWASKAASRVRGPARILRNGEVYIPRHARLHEYQCVTPTAVREALRRSGLSH